MSVAHETHVVSSVLPVQRSLRVGAVKDPLELEADEVADRMMRMPAPVVQRCPDGCPGDDELRSSPADQSAGTAQLDAGTAGRIGAARGGGSALPGTVRSFFEPRFGAEFSRVRVHADSAAADLAAGVNARAFTVGRDVFFGSGEFRPGSAAGDRLLAHELTHTLQQGAGAGARIRRQSSEPRGDVPTLDYHPARAADPCACLVFIHNNETNARRAAENLHSVCRFNLASISEGDGRRVDVPGSSTTIDPNELFPSTIRDECTRNRAACVRYVAERRDERSVQIQFFLAIASCSDNFTLPTVALHNNAIGDTARYRRDVAGDRDSGVGHEIASLMETVERDVLSGRSSRADLRARLRRVSPRSGNLMSRGGTTNIFRWCNLPEIGRCSVGDPRRPDHVVWVTRRSDFDRLAATNVNVVLQEDATAAADTESDRDLSTLFLNAGPDARYVNIETPIVPIDRRARRDNMVFILTTLRTLGLDCCPAAEEEAVP